MAEFKNELVLTLRAGLRLGIKLVHTGSLLDFRVNLRLGDLKVRMFE